MNFLDRRQLIGLGLAGVIGGPLLLAGYLSLGLFFAPPWPVADTVTPVPPLVGEALWARANGGANTNLNPFRPLNLAQLAVCIAQAETEDDFERQLEAEAGCRMRHMPGFGAVIHLSDQHLCAAGYAEPGFREGHARFVTTIWMARSWTKADLLGTLAARGEYGMGLRGLEAAAQGYFGRPSAQLTLPQIATVAALAGGTGPDPWCDPGGTAELRHRILEHMRHNQAIEQEAFEAADRSELGLAPPPPAPPPCQEQVPTSRRN